MIYSVCMKRDELLEKIRKVKNDHLERSKNEVKNFAKKQFSLLSKKRIKIPITLMQL